MADERRPSRMGDGRRLPVRSFYHGQMMLGRVIALAVAQAFVVGWVLHLAHSDPAEAHEAIYVDPALHYLRDSALAVPLTFLALCVATAAARRLGPWLGDPEGVRARAGWALLGAVAYAVAVIPGTFVHDRLFAAGHEGVSLVGHAAGEGLLTVRYSFALLVVFAAVWGVPYRRAAAAPGQPHAAAETGIAPC
jgi:hypothetical protein